MKRIYENKSTGYDRNKHMKCDELYVTLSLTFEGNREYFLVLQFHWNQASLIKVVGSLRAAKRTYGLGSRWKIISKAR